MGGGGEEHCGEGGGEGKSPRDGGSVDGGEGVCMQTELEVGCSVFRLSGVEVGFIFSLS